MQTIISERIVKNPLILETDFEEPKTIRWTKDEYHYLAELGFFEGKRTEFLGGEIIEMPTMNSPHATGLTLADDNLRKIFSENFVVRNQMPMNFGAEFEVVPDIVIIKGKARDFINAHPQTADLIVEISDTTLNYDRNRKASLFAKNGIEDYWILNLKNGRLEIYRRPITDKNAFHGFGYAEMLIFTEKDTVSPLAAPKAKIKVADLLP